MYQCECNVFNLAPRHCRQRSGEYLNVGSITTKLDCCNLNKSFSQPRNAISKFVAE